MFPLNKNNKVIIIPVIIITNWICACLRILESLLFNIKPGKNNPIKPINPYDPNKKLKIKLPQPNRIAMI
jgi:hypothetical protein